MNPAMPLPESHESPMDLAQYLDYSATQYPDSRVVNSDGSVMSYKELSINADKIATILHQKGIRIGDHVGLFMCKSTLTLAAIFGVLRLGAVYIPTDVDSSVLRASAIFNDCNVRIILTDSDSALSLMRIASQLKSHIIVIQSPNDEINSTNEEFKTLSALKNTSIISIKQQEIKLNYPRSTADMERIAYILYTSGSSGTPKGITVSHRNAISFIEWASAFFKVTEEDQVSSHAPFHFDLSVFDIYVSVKNGADIHLIDNDLAASPRHLATFISSRKITIWYSAPAILGILAEQHSKIPPVPNQLRLVLFAGEAFPISKLRNLMFLWPEPAYYNLYGPTETNVCTAYPVPTSIPADRTEPLSIGYPCSHCETIIVDSNLRPVPKGESGLLCISGPSVITRYWNMPEKTAQCIFYLNGKRWYNTGDVVRSSPEGYILLGRLDRMIKRHGYRIELDEIELCLRTHPKLSDCAVVSSEINGDTTITAFLVAYNGPLSPPELSKYCYERLAHYMMPNYFNYIPELPRTSTGKINYQFLERLSHAE